MGASLALQALDGSVVTIASDVPIGVLSPPTSSITYSLGGSMVEFTGGVAQLGEEAARTITGIALTEQLAYQDGTLRVGFLRPDGSEHVEIAFAVWEGAKFCLCTSLSNRTLAEIIATFEIGELSETDLGVLFAVHATDSVELHQQGGVVQGLEGIGVVGVTRTTRWVRDQLPPWEGTQVSGGELFIDHRKAGDEDVSILYLVNESAAARAVVLTAEASGAAERLGALTFAWSS